MVTGNVPATLNELRDVFFANFRVSKTRQELKKELKECKYVLGVSCLPMINKFQEICRKLDFPLEVQIEKFIRILPPNLRQFVVSRNTDNLDHVKLSVKFYQELIESDMVVNASIAFKNVTFNETLCGVCKQDHEGSTCPSIKEMVDKQIEENINGCVSRNRSRDRHRSHSSDSQRQDRSYSRSPERGYRGNPDRSRTEWKDRRYTPDNNRPQKNVLLVGSMAEITPHIMRGVVENIHHIIILGIFHHIILEGIEIILIMIDIIEISLRLIGTIETIAISQDMMKCLTEGIQMIGAMVPRVVKGFIMAHVIRDVVQRMTLGSHITNSIDLILIERTMG